ncbi:PQQ-dependent dehydrogenase, methanol/ethanol family [Derxia lacustris]|uniref:PQQ-dependent dehydrogenase, methanol/ethanol family n=1 Tax=Derxia lacustris TaxID=764842 RepID=UPI000A16D3FB|nr:PQQ-dependent dehydrogenase, methanol/ethanol family [Derxia lacustris]
MTASPPHSALPRRDLPRRSPPRSALPRSAPTADRRHAGPIRRPLAALLLAGLAAFTAPAGADADPHNRRHTPLAQITPANVGRLTLAWRFATGARRGHEGAPLVAGDTLYLVTPWPNRVIALDLASQRPRWTVTPEQDMSAPARMCCDTVNRGLAFAPAEPAPDRRRAPGRAAASATPATAGTLVLATADASLIALDAATGRQRWRVQLDDPARGASSSGAPRIFGNTVIAGIAGGEYGLRGHLDAYDLATGALRWRGWSTGPDADLLIDPERSLTWRDGALRPVGPDSSLASWPGDAWKLGGGTTWGAFAYDAQRNLVIYGSGNPGSWNPRQRPGDNRWTDALWARDLATGRVRWVFQLTPHDEWDYDGVNEALLFDGPAPARRPLLAHFDRNGFAYVLDRASGELLRADRYDPAANWARRIDLRSGRPEVDPAKSPQAGVDDEPVRDICPAAIGAKNQAPAAYSATRGLFYVPTVRLCMDMETFAADYAAGQPWIGASYTLKRAPAVAAAAERGSADAPAAAAAAAAADAATDATPARAAPGALLAWDALAGRARWTHEEALPLWGGALSTGSGLVFYGTLDARLKALDARSGKLLWTSPPLPSGVVGNVTSWEWRGRQYIGVLVGIGGLAADPDGIGKLAGVAPAPPADGELLVFALPVRR